MTYSQAPRVPKEGPFGPRPEPVRKAGAWQHLLVRLPNWVGDTVMVTPALRALRQSFPNARITALGRRLPQRVLQAGDLVDAAIIIERADEKKPVRLLRLARKLRRQRFDAAVTFTNSFGSALPLRLAGIPCRVGYAGEGRRFLLNVHGDYARTAGKRSPMPMPRYYQGVLDLVGIPPAGPAYEIAAPEDAKARLDPWLQAAGVREGRPLAVLNPGAAFGASKLWPAEHFAALGDWLSTERGAEVLVLGGPGEESIVEQILARATQPLRDGARPFLPLELLLPLFQRAKVLISTDSGPRHLGVAAGVPCVALIGPTHRAWSDWNLEQSRVLQHEVPCGPCHLKTCPIDHPCMSALTVERVRAAVDQLWSPIFGD